MTGEIPEGYTYDPPESAFPAHVGRFFFKTVPLEDGDFEAWTAIWVEPHHVNKWGLAHGGLIAMLGEVSTASVSYTPGGPPVVAIELNTHFVRAPKLGQLIEVRARATRRTKSLVFAEAHAYADGELMFTATGINKILAPPKE